MRPHACDVLEETRNACPASEKRVGPGAKVGDVHALQSLLHAVSPDGDVASMGGMFG